MVYETEVNILIESHLMHPTSITILFGRRNGYIWEYNAYYQPCCLITLKLNIS